MRKWDWVGFILFCLAVTWLTGFSVSNFPKKIDVGMVLKQEIKADRRISVINEEETKKDQEKAAEAVLPVFDFDEQIPGETPKRLHSLLSKPIVASADILKPYKETGIVLNRIHPPKDIASDERELIVKNVDQVLTALQAKKKVYPSLQQWIVPNITFNLKETGARKDAAIRAVKEKIIIYQPGDYILRAGTKLEPRDVDFLKRVIKSRGLENRPIRFLGAFLFVALALSATFYFSERFFKHFQLRRKDYLFTGLVVVLMLAVLRASLLLSGALHEAFLDTDTPRTALYYGIPIAGGVMLVRVFLSAEVSLVLAVILSLLAGITVGSDVNYTTYCLISGIAASTAIARASHRTAMIKAGLWTGLANAAALLGVLLIKNSSMEDAFQWSSMFWHLVFSFSGGIFASIFVFIATPVFEMLLGYASDIKLMELANLNHPLLKEMIVRAPGTYHHSHIVGILAESAAEAIGANPLLVKVGAYYHDIGKMKKPAYFGENASMGRNKHDNLTAHMSALIVASHVKEGIALAKVHKLPQKIIDMIPQHHGTKKIGFFFEKALEETDPGLQQIEEKDFRYPGPKPQSEEAGILMLADGVEATVRSLREKTPAKIQKTVEEIIDKSFAEAQLDECDLTLKDLHEIGKAFTRILTSLYHQRIAYADNLPDQKTPFATPAGKEIAKAGRTVVHKLKFPSH